MVTNTDGKEAHGKNRLHFHTWASDLSWEKQMANRPQVDSILLKGPLPAVPIFDFLLSTLLLLPQPAKSRHLGSQQGDTQQAGSGYRAETGTAAPVP